LATLVKLPGRGDAAMIEPLETLVSILVLRHKEVEAEQLLGDLLKSTPEGHPQRGGVLQVRGSFFARCRRWDEAAADLSKAVELEPSDDDAHFRLTVLLHETGETENYRAHCRKMVTDFRDANLPGPLGKAAEVSLLAAETGSDSEAARQLADQAFTLGQHSYWVHDLEFIKGLAEYRAGNFASANDWVGKTIGQPTRVGGPRPDAAAYSILAMAQHQSHRPQEARAALAKSADIVNSKLLKLENPVLDENWVDWLIAHILLREASSLLEGQTNTPAEKKPEPH